MSYGANKAILNKSLYCKRTEQKDTRSFHLIPSFEGHRLPCTLLDAVGRSLRDSLPGTPHRTPPLDAGG